MDNREEQAGNRGGTKQSIQIVCGKDGQKRAVCPIGCEAAATATFIYQGLKPLAAELQQARTLVLVSGPRATEEFPRIAQLCTEKQAAHYIVNYATRTPLQAAQEIMQGLFPSVLPESVNRMGRRLNKPNAKKLP